MELSKSMSVALDKAPSMGDKKLSSGTDNKLIMLKAQSSIQEYTPEEIQMKEEVDKVDDAYDAKEKEIADRLGQ
jgi:hypothetical protein